MQNETLFAGDLPPDITLTRLLDRHGTRAVLRALFTALRRRRPTRRAAGDLPDHLRRDIGLPERGQPPPTLRGPLM